ncbi:MAG TPA: MBL fold metallo-hydrolase [Acidimicrobiales bacterium]|nr:MBL fold metallo-hydrolase [Acidimicrobiales bacterium]
MTVPSVGFYGVRGSCPCSDPALSRYGGSTACVTVDAGDGSPPVLFDLGTGCRRLGQALLARFFPGETLSPGTPPREAHEPPRPPVAHGDVRLRLSAFVTHLHFDHVQGLPFFGPALQSDVHLDVYGPVQDGSLAEAFSAFLQPPYFPVGVTELPAELGFYELADGSEVQVGAAVVRAREVPHVGRTLGYRIEAAGVSVAYIGDHQAPSHDGLVLPKVSEAALELSRGVDLLIHDAQYTDAEFAVKAHWGHSTVGYALEIAGQAGARRLALFHHDPTHGDDELDRLAEVATERAGGAFEVVMAAEDMEIRLEGDTGPESLPAVAATR